MLGEVFSGHFGRPKRAKMPRQPCGEKAFSGAFRPGNHNAQGFAKGNYHLVLVHFKRFQRVALAASGAECLPEPLNLNFAPPVKPRLPNRFVDGFFGAPNQRLFEFAAFALAGHPLDDLAQLRSRTFDVDSHFEKGMVGGQGPAPSVRKADESPLQHRPVRLVV